MAGRVHIAAEVRAALGPNVVQAMERRGLEGVCRICDVRVATVLGDDVALVLERHLDGETFGVGHHGRCLESQILYTGRPVPFGEEDADVTSVALVLPGLDGDRAALVVAPTDQFESITPGGDALSPWESGLFHSGWGLLPRLGREAPLLAGWTVRLDPGNGRGLVLAANGEVFLDELPTGELPLWRLTALRDGEVTLLSSSSLGGLEDDVLDARFAMGLNRLARAGRLIAGRAEVEMTEVSVDPMRDASRSVAHDLQRAITARADAPGATDPDRALIPLPGYPRLVPALSEDVPLLLLELDDDDEERALATLAALETAGFLTGRSGHADYFLPNAPRGWGCVVWRSQAQVMARAADGMPRNLIFGRFDSAQGPWYDAVGRSQAVGLVVGNRIVGVRDFDEVVRRVEAGNALGMGVFAMLAG